MQLKVRRPGRHSNDAKAAAVTLMDIASTTSFQMPAPVRTPVRTTVNKQVSNPSKLSNHAILGPICTMICMGRSQLLLCWSR